jgi:hypothetical protein
MTKQNGPILIATNALRKQNTSFINEMNRDAY